MKFESTHFGTLDIRADGIVLFPDGIIGYENYRHWVILWEEDSDAVCWLQSLDDPNLVFSAVMPHRFVPQYVLRISRDEFVSLPWAAGDDSIVLALVSKHDDQLTINLKAPLLVNMDRNVARQAIVVDEQPLQYVLPRNSVPLRKSA